MASTTTLAPDRVVRRVVNGGRHGRLVVTMTAEGLMVREKGRRTTYGPLDWGWLFLQGAKMAAEERRKERAAARKARRAARG